MSKASKVEDSKVEENGITQKAKRIRQIALLCVVLSAAGCGERAD